MALFTISSSQNWSAISGGPPTSADQVNVNGNVTLTVDVNNASCNRIDIGVTNNSGGNFATLTFGSGTGSKLTVASQIRLGGNSALQDGKLIHTPGSTLDGAFQLLFNNGYWLSTCTQESERAWYKGTDTVDTLATGPRQDVELNYVSFVGTNSFRLYLQNTMGGATSKAIFSHCCWDTCRDPVFGSTDSPNTTPITFDYCDFREISVGQSITIRRATGGSGNFYANHCSFKETGSNMQILPKSSTGFAFTNCATLNLVIANETASGAITITDSLFATNLNTTGMFNPTESATGDNHLSGLYLLGLAASDNYHPVVPADSGGSGTHYITGCLLEAPAGGGHDEADLMVSKGNTFAINMTYNLIIVSADMWVGTHTSAPWSANLTLKNNTIATTLVGTADGQLFGGEGYPITGTVNVVNNLCLGNGTGGSYFANTGSTLGGNQHLSHADYNNYTGFVAAYDPGSTLVIDSGNTTKTVPGAHETALNPQFLDITRGGASWNQIFGSGIATVEAYTDFFLAGLNGYRGSPNYDQGGTVSPYNVKNSVDWIRFGFSPTNSALRGAGDPADGSPDIGAMPVYATGQVNPNLSAMLAM